jgi:hypothetical protein
MSTVNLFPEIGSEGSSIPSILTSIYFRYKFIAPAASEENTTSSCDVYLSTSSTSLGQEVIHSIYKNNGTNIIGATLDKSPQITNFITAAGFTISTGRITVASEIAGIKAFTLIGLEPGQTYNIVVRSTNNSTVHNMHFLILDSLTLSEINLAPVQIGYFSINDTILFGSNLCPRHDSRNNTTVTTGRGGISFFIFSFKPTVTTYSLYLTNSYTSDEQIVSIYSANSPINIINRSNILNRTSNIIISVSNAITFTDGGCNEIRVCTIENLITNNDYFLIVRGTADVSTLGFAGGLIDLTTSPPAPIPLKYEYSTTTLSGPGAFTALSATPGANSVSIAFTPGSTSSSLPTSYTVKSCPGGIIVTSTTSPILVTGLQTNTKYTFTITATNPLGSTLASTSATTWNVPAEPIFTDVTRGDRQVVIEFTPGYNGGDPNTTYSLTASPDLRTWSGITSPITLDGLTNGTEYTIIITSTNVMGTTSSIPIEVTPMRVPDRPTILSVVRGDRELTINFTPGYNGGDPSTTYFLTATPDGRTWYQITSPVRIDKLTNGIEYTIEITATNDIGTILSDPVKIVPFGQADRPTITSVIRGDRRVTLNFTAGSNGGDNTVTYTATSIPVVRSWIGSNSQIIADGLTPGVEYKFIITTVTQVSNISSIETSNVHTITNPEVVTDVRAKKGNGRAIISFNTGSNIADSSLLYTVTSIPDNKKATGITSPITIEGLTNGTSYTFTIITSNAIGSSLASISSNSITPSDTLDKLIGYDIITDINHFVNNIETLTITENRVITLADMKVDIARVADDIVKEARRELLKYIFEEKPNIRGFEVDRSEIRIPSSTTENRSVFIVKPSTSSMAPPLQIDRLVAANISVYADLPNIGSINRFLINKEILTITKIGQDEFLSINGKGSISTHKSGEIIIYNGRTIEFGSVLIS